MKPVTVAIIGLFFFTACGEGGLSPETAFLGGSDARADNSYPTLDGKLAGNGDLILLNDVYPTWNGKKLQGNKRLKVIAAE